MVGIGTVQKDDPRLTTRLEGRKGSDPMRIVLDGGLSIAPNAQLLHLTSDSDTLIVTGSEPAAEKRVLLEESGARLLALNDGTGQIDLTVLMDELGKMGITSLLIEGGSRVNGSALRAGIVDKIHMFYAPKICGGEHIRSSLRKRCNDRRISETRQALAGVDELINFRHFSAP